MKTTITQDGETRRPGWFTVALFFTYLVSVNLVAGYVAIELKYPSLYNVNAHFVEYAVPLPFYWGLAHVPSMLIYGIPLLLLRGFSEKTKRYFQLFCICSFLLLLLELDRKIPFLLFPKVDALTALVFSLVVSPPNRKDNPVLVTILKLSALVGVIALGVFTYSTWTHRTPELIRTLYVDGVFELKSIVIHNDFRKEMLFEVDLKRSLPETEACDLAQTLAGDVLRDYPFDDTYRKTIYVTFDPSPQESSVEPYPLGEISLSDAHKEKDGRFACYLKYKKNSDG